MEKIAINLTVNGRARTALVAPRLLLSDFIRQELALPGTHVGCEHGVCGSCNVLVDGKAVRSCLMFAVQTDGSEITTVEGYSANGLDVIQTAFWEEHGLQCGFCTPGMLAANPDPSDDEIREAIAGNLCRCTGYEYIINAIRSAAQKMRDESAAAPLQPA